MGRKREVRMRMPMCAAAAERPLSWKGCLRQATSRRPQRPLMHLAGNKELPVLVKHLDNMLQRKGSVVPLLARLFDGSLQGRNVDRHLPCGSCRIALLAREPFVEIRPQFRKSTLVRGTVSSCRCSRCSCCSSSTVILALGSRRTTARRACTRGRTRTRRRS